MPLVLTPEQTAEHLQMSRNAVYALLRQGKLPGKKIGGIWRVPIVALEEFLRQPDVPAMKASARRPKTTRSSRSLK
ncbi:MAG: helix-turn-helix domain-containing protein [Candidatus Hydrogenedentes bacterium]|nr:helix-turn-helix domain-containing protein [Candidatus Hydrogenedentota bacterium]